MDTMESKHRGIGLISIKVSVQRASTTPNEQNKKKDRTMKTVELPISEILYFEKLQKVIILTTLPNTSVELTGIKSVKEARQAIENVGLQHEVIFTI